MPDIFDLSRFVQAQEAVFGSALRELTNGRKTSHWMWFVFPQIGGFGFSPMAKRYAIGSIDEARAYLDHDILGMRLRQCAKAVHDIDGRSITEIFGSPDDIKLRSSMTLFSQATPDNNVFLDVLTKYFDGRPDPATLARL